MAVSADKKAALDYATGVAARNWALEVRKQRRAKRAARAKAAELAAAEAKIYGEKVAQQRAYEQAKGFKK